MVGSWVRCTDATVLCSDEAGLEFTADGTFYQLYADDSGRLWRGRGWGRRGWWETLVDATQPDVYQLRLYPDGAYGGTLVPVTLTGEASATRWNHRGICPGTSAKAGQ
jgi:hypothetical protein